MDSKVLKTARKIAIEFFILVFIIGFFSKSIANYFLPKVNTASVLEGGIIEKSVEIKGVVEPKDTMKVRFNGDLIVEEFLVDVGRRVKIGDPLFKIDTKYGYEGIEDEVEELKISLEKERLNYKKLTGSSLVYEKRISILNDRLKRFKEDLVSSEKLYKSGAISYSQVENKKQQIKDLEDEIEIEELQFKENNENLYIQIKSVQNNIKKLEDKIEQINKRQEFYSDIEEDGIYYSEVDGVLLQKNSINQLLRQDTVVLEIAKITDYSSVYFAGNLDEKYDDFVPVGKQISLASENMRKSLKVDIIDKTRIIENGKIKIIGSFVGVEDKKPLIGQELEGKIVEEYEAYLQIPKGAIIANGELKEGNKGKVYLVEEREGILGSENVVVEVEVEILRVGDDWIDVSGLGMFDKPNIITNVSYKIRDGVKVFCN